MNPREIRKGVTFIGELDWNRRLFDSLIPLPDGTSYNAYLIEGTEKTALLDTVDPSMTARLMANLERLPSVDFIVSHHTEQDHSGSIPAVLERYPEARVLCTPKAVKMLVEHVGIDAERIDAVADGDELALGGKTLKFIHTPWAHWPETMSTWLAEDKILFTCDLFGSHYASAHLYAGDDILIQESAKRYFAEIMMPYRRIILNNIKKLEPYPAELIAPSHGPIHDRPAWVVEAHRRWASEKTENFAVLAYVSMHGSTEKMVDYLAAALTDRGVHVQKFDLTGADLGKVAIALVDAGTLVVGAPAVNGVPHPLASLLAAFVACLRPKLKHWAMIGSYGWGARVAEPLASQLADLKLESLGTILAKGLPGPAQFEALDALADAIRDKHRTMNEED